MKKNIAFALIFFVGGIASGQNKNFIDQPYVEVTGSADTLVTPNEIFISITLSEKDTRDRVSLEELERKMVSGLKELGFDTEKDLTTSEIISNYKSYFLKSRDVIKTKTYTLKATNALNASRVFLKLEELGISNAFIERVSHAELENLRNLMRTRAVIEARSRAMALTGSLRQSVGDAIHIVEIENNGLALQGRAAGLQIRGISSIARESNDPPKIEFEKIRVLANVSVKFILK
jgi:uncharacterized protein YggE